MQMTIKTIESSHKTESKEIMIAGVREKNTL